VTGAARLPPVPWWCIAGAPRGLAVLTVLIPWGGCPLGVLVRHTLDRDRHAGLQSRVEKLGHRFPDLLAQSRSVLTEVFDVPLIKKEPLRRGTAGGNEQGAGSALRCGGSCLVCSCRLHARRERCCGRPFRDPGKLRREPAGTQGPKGPQAVHIA
jgi:hypothetical protein